MNNEAVSSLPNEFILRVGDQQIEMVMIPPGSFSLGSTVNEKGHREVESPVRTVKLSQPFYIGRYEITQAQYVAVMGFNPSAFEGESLAIDQVTFGKAMEFCAKLSDLVGKPVTLPTEAQWEYACRAGTKTRFYTGDLEQDLDRAAWYENNSNDTVHPVGQKEPNAFGLYDMLGNVWELCLDVLPDYGTIKEVDPIGFLHDSEGSMRGGGWMYDAEYCRCACGLRSNDKFGGSGIRIVINSQ